LEVIQPGEPVTGVDAVDRAIIDQLRVDGRATIRALARVLEMGEPAVRSRLRRLEETRAIRVVALADFEALGHEFLLFGKVKAAGRSVQEVAWELASIPEVVQVASTLAQFDLFFTALAHDRAHLNELVTRRFRSIVGVDAIRWELALDTLHYRADWTFFGDDALPIAPWTPTAQVDDVDLAIIGLLGHDARSTNQHLADRLGLSEGTIRSRIRRMEESHIIHITAITDLRALGLSAVAFVGVSVEALDALEVAKSLVDVDGIGMVMTTLGEYEVLLAAVATSREALAELVRERIRSVPGVARTEIVELHEVFKHSPTWAHLG
jgi:Lrp/AsnC family transcriptional regulator for asnA, asnC and gidA